MELVDSTSKEAAHAWAHLAASSGWFLLVEKESEG